MRVYEMTHGDALVILKNKKADRKDIVKALDLLLTFNDLSELKNLEKKRIAKVNRIYYKTKNAIRIL